MDYYCTGSLPQKNKNLQPQLPQPTSSLELRQPAVLHLYGKLPRQFIVHSSALSNSVSASVEGVCMCEHVQRGAEKTKGISQ